MKKTVILLKDIKHLKLDDEEQKQQLLNMFDKASGFEFVHLKQKDDKDCLCIHYDTTTISLSAIRAILATQGYELDNKYQSLNVRVTNLDCTDCVKVIEHVLYRTRGVLAVSGTYTTGAFRIEYNSQLIKQQTIMDKVESLGYAYADIVLAKEQQSPNKHKHAYKDKPEHQHKKEHASPKHDYNLGEVHIGCGGGHKHTHEEGVFSKYRELILSLTTGALWLIGLILNKLGYTEAAKAILFSSYLPGGLIALQDSIRALFQKRFTIESLMVFAAIGAGILGKLNEGVLLLFLFSLGHALEHFALEKAKVSIKALTDLSPKKALVKNIDGTNMEVMVEDLITDQIVVIKPGQVVPCDGYITMGSSTINQAAITGESIPVDKTTSDEVFAGTMNGQGLLEIVVTKAAGETMLSKIIRLVTEADTQKSGTQRFAEKFERVFVPVVLVAILLIALLPSIFGFMTLKDSFFMAIIVLVSASPCALALATPVAVLVGISRAAREGVLIKGGAALENLGRVKAIAFDKTGTLTEGNPSITSIVMLVDNVSEDFVLGVCYGLEQGSAHPLAHAIITYCTNMRIASVAIDDIQAINGAGLSGIYQGASIKFGNQKMFKSVPTDIQNKIKQLEQTGSTTMLLAQDDTLLAIIAIADKPRLGVKGVLLQLKQAGVLKNVMLTGDNVAVAEAIGAPMGIDKISASLLPEDKLAQIKDLTCEFTYTAMVGDGVNDAPAMANATVGIAMGGTKTDVAIETSNVVLMNDKLDKLPFAIRISQETNRIIKQNLFISLGVIVILVISGLFSLTNIVIAVGVHEGSSLIVIFNALRLLYTKINKSSHDLA